MHPNALARYDAAIARYLDSLTRTDRHYAAHYAHHAIGFHFQPSAAGSPLLCAPAEFGVTARRGARIRQDITAIGRAALVAPDNCPNCRLPLTSADQLFDNGRYCLACRLVSPSTPDQEN